MERISGDRVKISITIGYPHTDWNESEFLTRLEERITRRFGGCRVESKRGLWREDGNSTQPHTGELFEEDSVEFTLVTDRDVVEATRQVEGACIYAKVYTDGDVPVEWVNVETTQVQARHFKM